MAVTAAQVKAVATEFADVADARVDIFIAQAERRVNRAAYASKANDATIYLVAHLLTLDAQQGALAAGAKTSERLDSWNASYAAPVATADTASLAASSWGRAYAEMRRTTFARRDL